ncbi:MAG: hypothetical protein ACI399_01395 [Candidatus Cryptobacteroides sp.]
MKKEIKLLAMLAAAVMLAGSCDEKEDPVSPEFPSTVDTRTVEAGGSVVLTLDANMDWTLSVEGDGAGNYFWIDDNGLKETSISGQAGRISATIAFSDVEELDNNRVCSVNLKMGSETRKVAEYTRLALERTFQVYVGQAGEYEYAKENGSYLYSGQSVSEAELITFAGKAEYGIPVKVVSNFAWSLSLPDWLSAGDLNSGEAGSTEFVLTAVLSAENAAGVTADVHFIDGSCDETLAVTLPAYADRLEADVSTSFVFNADGLQQLASGFQEVPGIIYVLASEGFVVRALEFDGQYHDIEYADWVHAEVSWVHAEVSYTASDNYLKKATVEVEAAPNKGAARCADILVLPASLADTKVEDLCDPNSEDCALYEKFQPYLVCRLQQDAVEVTSDYITLSESEDDTYKATLEKLGNDSWILSYFETKQAYTLTYSDEYSESVLLFNEAFDHFELYDYDCNRVNPDSFWIEFNPFGGNLKGRLYMYPDAYSPIEGEDPESFIVFCDADENVLAVVQCLYKAGQQGGGSEGEGSEGIISLTNGTGNVQKLSSSDDIYKAIYNNTGISDVYSVTVSSFSSVLVSATDYWNISLHSLDFSTLTDGSFSIEPFNEKQFTVYVGESVEEVTSCIIVLWGQNEIPFAAIYFTWDPEAKDGGNGGGASGLFSFVAPEYVTGATLEKCTDTEILRSLKGEFGVVDQEKVYILTYTQEYPMMPTVKCPSVNPGPAWNNYNQDSSYWLQGEYENGTLYVTMNEVGLMDFFYFRDASWNTLGILVCTRIQ